MPICILTARSRSTAACWTRRVFLANEHVVIYNMETGARFGTYVIQAPAGSGVVGLNGAAARLAIPGDKLIIVAYASFNDDEARTFSPRVVRVDRDKPDSVGLRNALIAQCRPKCSSGS